jgi:putative transposase
MVRATWCEDIVYRAGSPWENGYIESFNGKLRDELLNGEIFDTVTEARVVIEQWRREYNQRRPHSALGYRPPAPEAFLPVQINQLDLKKELTIIPVGI